MKHIPKKLYLILTVVLCALVMSLVDGVLRPGYAVKSAIKILLFLAVPVGYFLTHREERPQFRALFRSGGRDILIALGLGVGVYGFLLGGYFLLRQPLDIDTLALELTASGGVHADNFVAVSLYISFVNSFLEEFLFRGFSFITLKRLTGRPFAYIFSAAAFSFYHFGMFAGSGGVLIQCLALIALFLAGCILNFLNEKSGNIYVSWLVHMFANFGINTVGFLVFDIL